MCSSFLAHLTHQKWLSLLYPDWPCEIAWDKIAHPSGKSRKWEPISQCLLCYHPGKPGPGYLRRQAPHRRLARRSWYTSNRKRRKGTLSHMPDLSATGVACPNIAFVMFSQGTTGSNPHSPDHSSSTADLSYNSESDKLMR